jgi:hypothetical protein
VNASEDATVMRVIAASATGRAIGRVVAGVERGWRNSRARAAMGDTVHSGSTVHRVRAGGLMALVAALVALVLPLAGTRPEPLFWVVPAIAAIVALVVIRVASPGRQETRRA